MSNLKTSVLINRQIPEYIRDEYPAFINFVEAYYEFLEMELDLFDNKNITSVSVFIEESPGQGAAFTASLPWVSNSMRFKRFIKKI